MFEGTLVIQPGAVVVFEGLDRTGKSTQLSRLRDALVPESAVFAHMPRGFGRFTERVYAALEGETVDEKPSSGLAQQLAHLACHAESITHLTESAASSGLVLDRWWWSTLAYGWYGGSVEQSRLSEAGFLELIDTIWSPIVPSVVFVFLEPHQLDSNNNEGVEAGYRALIEQHPDLAVVVHSDTEHAVHALVVETLLKRGLASSGQEQ
ncbi:dTMP kinase [Kocuria marina]|uniref:dTMP kinase n=1 Tax=Kocuria marina TaxID=223184 RepID=UPI0011A95054|nr:hypothetical protein [Kocuria indica]